MPENIGGPSAPFNTQIASITDNADIQTAFRLYHYGSNTSTPSTIPENSLAGHLNVISLAKINKAPENIPTSTNLNTYVSTGFYTQTGTPTGANYPSNFPGLLTVVNDGGVVFQSYQVVGASETGESVNTLNRTWWRFNFAGSWRPWRTFVQSSDFAALGDPRYVQGIGNVPTFISNYYTQSDANALFFTKQSAEDSRYISENTVTGNYTLQISDVGKVISVNNSAPATITIPLNSSVTFPIGTLINVYARTTQPVFVAVPTGTLVTLRPANSIRLFSQYTEISLRKRDTNEWVASGNFI
jgi:hypothetical protein